MIMALVKKGVRHTFIWGIIKHFRAYKIAKQWTTHDQEMLEFYSQFMSAGDVCFDVGANIGNRTKIFLKLGAKVVAVEPQKECLRVIRAVYGRNKCLTVIQKVLGASEGEAELMISSANTISSLSYDWIEAVKRSGRFDDYSWEKKQIVNMTTLDSLIATYGIPSFIKIDVEGFEYQVIQGLSQPIRTISLEFTPEFIESIFKCIDYLQSIGNIRLNYSIGENSQLALDKWVNSQEMKKILTSYKDDSTLFGDVYAQFV